MRADWKRPGRWRSFPDGRLLITERAGRLRILDNGKLSEPVKGTPTVHEQQDGGMFDVEIHPQYAKNGWVYLAYSEVRPGFVPPPPAAASTPAAGVAPGRGRGPSIPSMTVVVRGKINAANEWTDQQVIFRAPGHLYTPSGSHFGCRLIFDKAGHLYYTLGERGAMETAQDLTNPLGKIHRVNDDGSAPKDNPFVVDPAGHPHHLELRPPQSGRARMGSRSRDFCGSRSTDRPVVTKSTSSRAATTTGGVWRPKAHKAA